MQESFLLQYVYRLKLFEILNGDVKLSKTEELVKLMHLILIWKGMFIMAKYFLLIAFFTLKHKKLYVHPIGPDALK